MRAADVTDTLELALVASGCNSAKVMHKPPLLSDNGSSYISSDLAERLQDRRMAHARGAPCHPQTQGKIERWHQTLTNRILLENYYLPGDLEATPLESRLNSNPTSQGLHSNTAQLVQKHSKKDRRAQATSALRHARERSSLPGAAHRLGRFDPPRTGHRGDPLVDLVQAKSD
jgi:putative transposase